MVSQVVPIRMILYDFMVLGHVYSPANYNALVSRRTLQRVSWVSINQRLQFLFYFVFFVFKGNFIDFCRRHSTNSCLLKTMTVEFAVLYRNRLKWFCHCKLLLSSQTVQILISSLILWCLTWMTLDINGLTFASELQMYFNLLFWLVGTRNVCWNLYVLNILWVNKYC